MSYTLTLNSHASIDKLCGRMNPRQLLKKRKFVIPSYDYLRDAGTQQNSTMPTLVPNGTKSRRFNIMHV